MYGGVSNDIPQTHHKSCVETYKQVPVVTLRFNRINSIMKSRIIMPHTTYVFKSVTDEEMEQFVKYIEQWPITGGNRITTGNCLKRVDCTVWVMTRVDTEYMMYDPNVTVYQLNLNHAVYCESVGSLIEKSGVPTI
jgi:hypothetical protein